MAKPSNFEAQSTLPKAHIDLALRLRTVRAQDRFSQSDLAADLSLTRSAIANYEYGRARVPFTVGMDICRRLDINQQWFVRGIEPKRPFIAPEELGINDEQLDHFASRSSDFIDGFERFLSPALDDWLKRNPPERIIARALEGGPVAAAQRASAEQLQGWIVEYAARLKDATVEYKPAMLVNLEVFTAEMRRRLQMHNPAALRAMDKWTVPSGRASGGHPGETEGSGEYRSSGL